MLVQGGLDPPQSDNISELTTARSILEIGAFVSVRTHHIPSFDRYLSQLSTFYTDLPALLPPSPREAPLRGLNLIRLLTQNRI